MTPVANLALQRAVCMSSHSENTTLSRSALLAFGSTHPKGYITLACIHGYFKWPAPHPLRLGSTDRRKRQMSLETNEATEGH
jgi:hypothetical protein